MKKRYWVENDFVSIEFKSMSVNLSGYLNELTRDIIFFSRQKKVRVLFMVL